VSILCSFAPSHHYVEICDGHYVHYAVISDVMHRMYETSRLLVIEQTETNETIDMFGADYG
jgi:hypothetical protein